MLLFLLFIVPCVASPGPKYPPTRGEVWPRPQNEIKLPHRFIFLPTQFEIKIVNRKCQILVNAVERHMETLLNLNKITRRARRRSMKVAPRRRHDEVSNRQITPIRQLLINLTAPCEDYPHYEMDESYNLTILTSSELTSNSIWGILNGLETASQLFYLSEDYSEIHINATSIVDYPTYPHRGLLLDTGRHYISPENILKTLDAMAMNKMNVFHWHIVDDQSFPYQSFSLPELSEKGAYYPEMVYTKSQIKSIIQYARDRGIRVLPEFDVPGHTLSWGLAYPSVLTECYDKGKMVGLGPMHPLKNHTYKLVSTLYSEVQKLFPDKYFHVGGDEVDLECWSSNPAIQQYMKDHNLTDVRQMHELFLNRVLTLLKPDTVPVVWQEVFDDGVELPEDAIVQVWKSEWQADMARVLNSSHRLILSSPWYLDYLAQDFKQLYNMAPREWVADLVPPDQLNLVVGGEACMWGEMVDDTNLLSRVWPRASALAELLWSSIPSNDTYMESGSDLKMLSRAEEHTCRMRRRGVPAEPPAGPGFCVL